MIRRWCWVRVCSIWSWWSIWPQPPVTVGALALVGDIYFTDLCHTFLWYLYHILDFDNNCLPKYRKNIPNEATWNWPLHKILENNVITCNIYKHSPTPYSQFKINVQYIRIITNRMQMIIMLIQLDVQSRRYLPIVPVMDWLSRPGCVGTVTKSSSSASKR